ncbi:MAG: HugZ family protein [Candidatus Odyssella sp.]|nr:HugZ family protein [Candidatus Odyssella sp.]
MSEAANRAEPPPAADPAPAAQARALLRSGLTATLATVGADGAPYASFVGYATRLDGAPVFLFSGLAAHTRNLARDPRFSLLIAAPPRAEGDPMDSARLTLGGRAERADDPALRARYLRRHPKAELYAGLPDFRVLAATVTDAHIVGGFARARGLAVADVLLDVSAAAALAEAEAGIVAHMNDDHAEAVGLYATRLLGQPAAAWRLTGIDPEGFDLRAENRTARLVFERRIATPAEARDALVALARTARA